MNQPLDREPITREAVGQLLETAQTVLPEDGVFNKLASAEQEGRALRIKMGFDPTSPDLHLGHAVSMHMLRRFQDLGHTPVIIIGDFTGRIGDPSGRNQSRPLATPDEIARNAETYIDQLGKVLDTSRIEVRRNSEWLEGMSLPDVIHLLSQGTLSQVITRDDFRQRLNANSPIALHEIIYPFLQGMDSVATDADIEIGGVDQLYAFQAARSLQGNRGVDPEALVMMPLLRGLDGNKKMSKSLGNYVGLSDRPEDMFGKVMSAPDSLLAEYLHLASTLSREEVQELLAGIEAGENPMDAKLKLAHNITHTYHGPGAADEAQGHFNRQFRTRSHEEHEYRDVEIGRGVNSLVDVLVAAGAAPSRNQARRLISGGGVYIDGRRVLPDEDQLDNVDGLRIRAGKRHFFKTRLTDEQ